MVRTIVLIAAVLLVLLAGVSSAADRQAAILDFSVYPDQSPSFNKLAGFTWPEVEELNALVRIDLAGFIGEQKVDLFMVVRDDDDEVISKHRGKHWLPAGEHDLLFPEFIRTDSVFGERTLYLEVELALRGAAPVYDELAFDITGPGEPEVDIWDIEIYNPEQKRKNHSFAPGEAFVVEAVIEIENNESTVQPELVLFAMMEEDGYLVDPDLSYQPYKVHWDMREVDFTEGVYEVRAAGVLPMFFAEPYNFSHDWRVYVIVDFGPGAVTSDYRRAELRDFQTGSHRESDELADRLIEIERSYRWETRRLRGDKPDTDRFWE